MLSYCKFYVVIVLLFIPSLVHADSWNANITYEQWQTNTTARTVISIDPIARLLQSFLEDESSRIIIRYPGGDKGERWSDEVVAHLVALGIPSNFIEAEPGSGDVDKIKLFVEQNSSS